MFVKKIGLQNDELCVCARGNLKTVGRIRLRRIMDTSLWSLASIRVWPVK